MSMRRVQETHEALVDAGLEDAAAELRSVDTFTEQKRLAIQLRREHEVTL